MPGISVRRIEDEVYKKLRDRAKRHGVSMEEEVRRILRSSVSAPDRLGDFALDLFGKDGVDLVIPDRAVHEPVDFAQ